MGGFRDYHINEEHWTEKQKYHMIPLICGIKKNYTDEHIYKTEIDSQTKKKCTVSYQRRWQEKIN